MFLAGSKQEIVTSGCLEARLQQERMISFQQLDAVVFEFLEVCSNSFGIPLMQIRGNLPET